MVGLSKKLSLSVVCEYRLFKMVSGYVFSVIVHDSEGIAIVGLEYDKVILFTLLLLTNTDIYMYLKYIQ